MAGRRGTRGSHPAAIEADPDFPHIIFKDEAQKVRFQKLKHRMIAPTRFVHSDLLHVLGIADITRTLFVGMGIEQFLTLYHGTYADLTLEFLSSLEIRKHAQNDHVLYFRLSNVNRRLTLRQFAQLFGMTVRGERKKPETFLLGQLWEALTGVRPPNCQHLQIKSVHHPSIRFLLKFLGSTIFGRWEPNTSRTEELSALGTYLWPVTMPIQFDLAYAFMHHLHKISTTYPTFEEDGSVRSSVPIVIGGLVTHIACHFGHVEIRGNAVPGPSYLDHDHFLCARYIVPSGRNYRWMIAANQSILLPDPTLAQPLIEDDHTGNAALPTYLLPEIGRAHV